MFRLRQTRPCLALPPGSAHPSPSSFGNFQTFQHFNLSTFRQGSHSSLATAPLTPFPATLRGKPQLTENPVALSRVVATLTRHVHHNLSVCHSYRKHPGSHLSSQRSFRSGFSRPNFLPTWHSPLATKSFTIRTYIKSAHKLFIMNTSKTQDLKPFRMNTYKKRGRGDPRPYSSILSDLELSSRPAAVVRGGGDAHAFYRRLQDLHELVRVGIEATGRFTGSSGCSTSAKRGCVLGHA
jgi:hypothetical protein